MSFLEDYDFELDPQRVALRPVSPKHDARMLVVNSVSCDALSEDNVSYSFADTQFWHLPDYLKSGDLLVFNNTKVIKALVSGTRIRAPQSGGDGRAQVESLFHKALGSSEYEVFLKPQKRVRLGDTLDFDGVLFRVDHVLGGGVCHLRLMDGFTHCDVSALFERVGQMPLPPYIASKREVDERDTQDYQSFFACHEGAVAAPTASLHFTPELLQRLEDKGVQHAEVTLHVGAGTFLPVKADRIEDHKMHSEWGEVTDAVVEKIRDTQRCGGRVVAVGTTVLRILESAARCGYMRSFQGETDIFITPGFKFHVVDGLITNFHLPKSTLLALVRAFGGVDVMRQAYDFAIAEQYRFFSYGDGSLIWRRPYQNTL